MKKTSDKVFRFLVILCATLFFMVGVLALINFALGKKIEKQKREQAEAKLPAIYEQIEKIVENNKDIYKIEPYFEYDGVNFIHLYVRDTWFNTSSEGKKRFAAAVRNNVKDILYSEGFIEADDRVGIYVYSTDGILLAENDMYGQIELIE